VLSRKSGTRLRRQLNSLGQEAVLRRHAVRKCGGERAIINLGAAFSSFFKKCVRYPWFKKKGGTGSFCAANQAGKPRMDGQRTALPIAGAFFLNAAGLTPGHGTFQ